ncbi:hypothetical protein GYMLUDRAFT_215127 [Collybiopsis luxurians FD-317 M1]|nr:hypothetical protein GYMLUDRAFT_215127 [Collybiopsis luxurians FD-317 M1]
MSVDDCEVHPCMNAQTEPSAMTTTDTRQAGKRKRKPAKMHQCEICLKQFPRPSGLKTHMNTHNNYKPFSCTYPGCTRTFTVRSNAKRHLRTHGNNLLDDVAIPGTAPRATVPDLVNKSVINELEHDLRSAPAELKWMPISLSSHTNVVSLNSIQEESDSDWEDAKDDSVVEQSLRALSFPLRPVLSFEAHEGIYEERNSYEEAESYPLLC